MSLRYTWIRAALLAGWPLVSGAAFAAEGAVTLRSGVLVSDDAAYLMQPGGGVEAVTLGSGKSIWSTKAADRPVAAQGGAVVAQREAKVPGQLTMVTLDAARGEAMNESVVVLPKGVTASVDDRLDSQFAIAGDAARSDRLVWRYETRKAQGVMSEDGAAPVLREAGVLALSTDRREVSALTTEPVSVDQPKRSRTIRTDSAPAGSRSFVSEDGAHVLHSRRDGAGYVWSVRGRDGNVLGDVTSGVSYSPFIVRDGLVLFVQPPRADRIGGQMVGQPRALVALDLGSGDVRWTRPVRETRYNGPFPH